MPTEFIELEATIDLSKWNAAIASMIGDSDKVSSGLKFDATANVKIAVDDSALRTASGAVDEIDSQTATVKIGADDQASDAIQDIQGSLTRLQQLATIHLVLDAAQFLSTFESLPIISTLADIDKQTDLVIGRTGRELPEAGRIIRNVYNNAWGESREEVAGVVTQLAVAKNANDDFALSATELEAAVLSAYDAAAVGGADVNEVIRAAKNLVGTGLVDSYSEAFDFIAKGFQNNLNQGDDFLDTITEYSQQFRDAGLSAEGFFNLMNTAVVTGNFNTDKAADAFKEFFNLVHEEVADFERTGTLTPRVEQLNALGLIDETQAFSAGELSGDAYAQAVLDKIAAIPDDAQRLLAAKQIFGPTQVEEIGEAFFENLDLGAAIDWQGTASEGSTIINDNLSTALTEASRTFEDAMVAALDNALNLSGFLDKVTGAATTFADSIQAGMTIGQALEISLALPEGSFARFESSVGNFAIGVLQLIAGVQDFLGGDSTSTRATIARMGETQLAFDLQVANPEDVANIVQTAIDRGVSDSGIQAAVGTSVQELVDVGNLDEAYALIQSIRSETQNLSDDAITLIEKFGSVENAIAELDKLSFDLPVEEELRGAIGADIIDTTALTSIVDSSVDTLFTQYEDAIAASDFSLATELGKKLGQEDIETAKAIATEQLSGFLTDTFTTATGAFDPITATDLVDLPQMDTDFANTAVNVKVSNDAMINSAHDLQRNIADVVTVTVANAETLAVEGGANIDKFRGVWQALSGAVTDTVVNLSEPLGNFAAMLGLFVDVGTMAVQVGSKIGEAGGVPNPTGVDFGFASGGSVPPGVHMFGEQGTELGFTDDRMAVLNNRTSEAFMAGMNMGGGGNTYVTLNNVFNAGSAAASIGGINMVNNQMRGYLK